MFMISDDEINSYIQTRDFIDDFQDDENLDILNQIEEEYFNSLYVGGEPEDKSLDEKFPVDRCYKLNNMKLKFDKSLEHVKDLDVFLGEKIHRKVIKTTLKYKLYKEKMEELMNDWKKKNNDSNVPSYVIKDIKKTARAAMYPQEEFTRLSKIAYKKIHNAYHLLNFERQLVNMNYVIYHGTSASAYIYLLFNNVLENIYKPNDGTCTPLNMFNMRYSNQPFKYNSVDSFKKDYNLEKFKMFHETVDEKNGEWNDTIPSLKKFLISTNVFLFGNFSHPGECTMSYYITSLSHTSSDFIINMMKTNLIDAVGEDFYKKNASRFDNYFTDKIKKLINNVEEYYEENIILQISFPREIHSIFDKFNYLSIPGGGYINISPSVVYEALYNKEYKKIQELFSDFLNNLSPEIRTKFSGYLTDADGNILPIKKLIPSLQLRTIFNGELMESADILVNETIHMNVKSSLIYTLTNIIDKVIGKI